MIAEVETIEDIESFKEWLAMLDEQFGYPEPERAEDDFTF